MSMIECTRSAQGARSERYAGTRRAPPSSHLLPICYLPVTVLIVFLVFSRFVRLLAGLLHRELQKTTRKAQGDPTIAQFPILVLVAAPTVIFSNLHT